VGGGGGGFQIWGRGGACGGGGGGGFGCLWWGGGGGGGGGGGPAAARRPPPPPPDHHPSSPRRARTPPHRQPDSDSDSARGGGPGRVKARRPLAAGPPLPAPRTWGDFAALAASAARLSPRTAPALIRAAAAAAGRDGGGAGGRGGAAVAADLRRAAALVYGNAPAALRMLTDLSDADSLLALAGGGGAGGPDPAPPRPKRHAVPAWQRALAPLEGAPAASVAAVAAACSDAALIAARSHLPDVAADLAAAAASAARPGAPPCAARATALAVVAARGRMWETCDACGRNRLASRRPPPHEPFLCGGAAALLADRCCDDASDSDTDWVAPADDDASTLDPVPRSFRSGHGVPPAVAAASRADADLLALPAGWRKVVYASMTAEGGGTMAPRVDVAFVSPDGSTAAPSAAAAAAAAGVSLPPKPPARPASPLPPRPLLRITVPPSAGGGGSRKPPLLAGAPPSPRVAALASAAALAAATCAGADPRSSSPTTPAHGAGRRPTPKPGAAGRGGAPPSPPPPPAVAWRGRVTAAASGRGTPETLFTLEGAVPAAAAGGLPPSLRVVAVRSRRDVFVAAGAVGAATPILLHLAHPSPAQRAAAAKLEACRLAVVVAADSGAPSSREASPVCHGLVPHNNPLHGLHFVGVRLGGGLAPSTDAKEVAAALAAGAPVAAS